MKWTLKEIKRLEKIYDSKPAWVTDYELAGQTARLFHKSPESIRWQLRQFHREPDFSFPKILILDIETLPINADVWGTRKQYIQPHQIRKDWSIVCWSAKWLFGTEKFGEHVSGKEAINREDKSILGGIWTLLNEAQIVITQNGNEFDLKRLNTQFLINGFPKPMYYKSVDTYKVLTENFAFTYNKLDWVADVLGIGRKVQTNFHWWKECADGKVDYIRKMLEYNHHDVALTEELYLKLRPWISNHPNLNLFSLVNVHTCPNCGNSHVTWDGLYQTPLGLYKAFRCQKCGAIGRSTRKKFKISESEVQ